MLSFATKALWFELLVTDTSRIESAVTTLWGRVGNHAPRVLSPYSTPEVGEVE